MSIISRGFFPFTVEGERPRRGEVIGEEYLIIFFLSRKSPNSISCHIFSTQHKTIPDNNNNNINTSPSQYFLRLGIIINDFTEREETFYDYKKQNFSKSKISHFSKGVNPSIGIF